LSQKQAIYQGETTIREFKLCLFSLGVVTQHEVNNLAKYMDRRNNGFILLADVKMALDGEGYTPKTVSA